MFVAIAHATAPGCPNRMPSRRRASATLSVETRDVSSITSDPNLRL